MTTLDALFAISLALTPPTPAVTGTASWYDYRPGHAAAGPALRRALGPGWRGTTVTVCRGKQCADVILSDWCECYAGTKRERVIDLDDQTFALLGALKRGIVLVEVR